MHGADALECMDQAIIYERRSRKTKDLGEFMALGSKVQHPALSPWVSILRHDREALWSEQPPGFAVAFVIGQRASSPHGVTILTCSQVVQAAEKARNAAGSHRTLDACMSRLATSYGMKRNVHLRRTRTSSIEALSIL